MNDKPICPKCGAESMGICVNCYLEDHPVTFNDFDLEMCECGRVRDKGQWNSDLDEVIGYQLTKNVVFPDEAVNTHLEFDYVREERKLSVDVTASGFVEDLEFQVPGVINVKLKGTSCPDCSKVSSGYFEAILQVRTQDFNPPVDEKQLIDMVEVKGGMDVYIGSATYAKKLCQKLETEGFVIKESNKIFGMREGKEIYRFFFSIKKPKFNKGDVIEYKDSLYRVLHMGQDTRLEELKSGNSFSEKAKKLFDSKIIVENTDFKNARVTMVTPDTVQFMDTETLKLIDERNTGHYAVDDIVEYTEIENKRYYFKKRVGVEV